MIVLRDVMLNNSVLGLTHWGLVTPYDTIIEPLPEPMLTYHQWSTIDGIHLSMISQDMLKMSVMNFCLKISGSRLQSCVSGINELTEVLI